MADSIQIYGGAELIQKMRKLAPQAEAHIQKKALRAGAKIYRRQAKMQAISQVGGKMGAKLSRAIGFRTKNKRGYQVTLIQFRKGLNKDFVYTSKKGKRSYIPSAIEWGHILRGWVVEQNPNSKKRARPIPFLRTAWKMSQDRTMDAITTSMRRFFARGGIV